MALPKLSGELLVTFPISYTKSCICQRSINARAPDSKERAAAPASTGAGTSGSGVISYADGSTQSYTLGAPNWVNGPTDTMAVQTPRWNGPAGPTGLGTGTKLYAVSVPVDAAKPVVAVTLPRLGPIGTAPALHVFSLGLRPASHQWATTWSTAIDGGLAPWVDRSHAADGGAHQRGR
jgi:hypothetical protein